MSDFSNGFGAIFRQAFVGKRGNLADALFAIADAIQELGSRPTQRVPDALLVCGKCGLSEQNHDDSLCNPNYQRR